MLPSYPHAEALSDAARQARTVVALTDPQFAAAAVDDPTNTLIIYRVPPRGFPAGSTLEAAYRAVLPEGAKITFANALVSAREVAELDALVSASLEEFDAAGYGPTSWGREGPQGRYLIDFPEGQSPPKTVLNRLAKHISQGHIVFKTRRARPASGPSTPNRAVDTSPF